MLIAENPLAKGIGDIFHPLFSLVATVLAYIYSVVPNYAFAIALLTVIIMGILTPLTVKSTKSMIAMQAIQPEVAKLRQKFKGPENREVMQQELMRLYRENNVNPVGSCLPVLLQTPALIVLYDIIRGLAYTVKQGTVLSPGVKCLTKVCASPRYIPASSKMYANLVHSGGVMKSFGMNLSISVHSHHASTVDYIPYLLMVGAACGLQYLQMSQMNKRNRGNAAMQNNPQMKQMQTMTKMMPLLMLVLYIVVPAGALIYMIVSSGIRILTQDLIFRFGIVALPGAREIGGGDDTKKQKSATAVLDVPSEEVQKEEVETTKPKSQGVKASPNGRTNGSSKGSTNGKALPKEAESQPKAHPRSKTKRARKAR